MLWKACRHSRDRRGWQTPRKRPLSGPANDRPRICPQLWSVLWVSSKSLQNALFSRISGTAVPPCRPNGHGVDSPLYDLGAGRRVPNLGHDLSAPARIPQRQHLRQLVRRGHPGGAGRRPARRRRPERVHEDLDRGPLRQPAERRRRRARPGARAARRRGRGRRGRPGRGGGRRRATRPTTRRAPVSERSAGSTRATRSTCSSSARATASPMPRRSPSPNPPHRRTTRCSSTGRRAWGKLTCCRPSANTSRSNIATSASGM